MPKKSIFEVGDTVKIVNKRPKRQGANQPYWNSEMDKYLGKVVKITDIDCDGWLTLDDDFWSWSDKWVKLIKPVQYKYAVVTKRFLDEKALKEYLRTNKDAETDVYALKKGELQKRVFPKIKVSVSLEKR